MEEIFIDRVGWLARALFFAILLNPCARSDARTFHVSKSGDGTDGLTWETAFMTIGEALTVAAGGDEASISYSTAQFTNCTIAQNTARDSGTSVSLTTDRDGKPRPIDGPGVGIERPEAFDRGAYEIPTRKVMKPAALLPFRQPRSPLKKAPASGALDSRFRGNDGKRDVLTYRHLRESGDPGEAGFFPRPASHGPGGRGVQDPEVSAINPIDYGGLARRAPIPPQRIK